MTDFRDMTEHPSNDDPGGVDGPCAVTAAPDLGCAEAPRDALAAAFDPLVPPLPIEAAEERNPSSSPHDFVASVRQAIERLSCGEDYPTISATAQFVGMSVRTLQRRLAQAGATHQMLVAQARFATAAAVLEGTDAKILELALDLGYSDHANFTRAFRRWSGCTPREYRSNNLRHVGVPGTWLPRITGAEESARDIFPRTVSS